MFYDRNLHFVSFKENSETPGLITIDPTTLEPTYQLNLKDFTFYLSEIDLEKLTAQLDILIEDIQQSFQGNTPDWDTLKRILHFTAKQMRSTGGKLSWIHGSTGSYIPKGSKKDSAKRFMYNCNDSDFQKISADLHRSFAWVDTYLFNHSKNKNLSTIGELIRLSGGDMFLYPNGDESSMVNFYNDLMHNCSKSMTWETVFRLRTSEGWTKHAYGNFFTSNFSDLLKMQGIDENYTIYYKFSPNPKQEPKIHSDLFFVQVTQIKTAQ